MRQMLSLGLFLTTLAACASKPMPPVQTSEAAGLPVAAAPVALEESHFARTAQGGRAWL